MKVKIIKTGEIKSVDDAYGVRMIEQGQAVASVEAEARAERRVAAKPDAKTAAGK